MRLCFTDEDASEAQRTGMTFCKSYTRRQSQTCLTQASALDPHLTGSEILTPVLSPVSFGTLTEPCIPLFRPQDLIRHVSGLSWSCLRVLQVGTFPDELLASQVLS